MEYIEGRFKKQEREDIERFIEFVAQYPKNYALSAETVYGTVVDVVSQDENGNTYATELKTRRKGSLNYPDCYIEVKKWENLMKLWRENKIYPLYINFFEDADDIYIWDLPMLKSANFYPNVWLTTIKEEVDRIGLPWKAAYHINKNIVVPPDKQYIKNSRVRPQHKTIDFNNKIDNKILFNL